MSTKMSKTANPWYEQLLVMINCFVEKLPEYGEEREPERIVKPLQEICAEELIRSKRLQREVMQKQFLDPYFKSLKIYRKQEASQETLLIMYVLFKANEWDLVVETAQSQTQRELAVDRIILKDRYRWAKEITKQYILPSWCQYDPRDQDESSRKRKRSHWENHRRL